MVCLGRRNSLWQVHREWWEVTPQGCCHRYKELCMPHSTVRDLYPVMQRAEVQENLSILLAHSKGSAWRTGCERHGLTRTGMATGAGLPGEVSATPAITGQGHTEHRQQSKQGVRVDMPTCTPCEIKTQAVYKPGSRPRTDSVWLLLARGAGRAPRVPQHSHRWPSLYSPGREGELELGKGPVPTFLLNEQGPLKILR